MLLACLGRIPNDVTADDISNEMVALGYGDINVRQMTTDQ